MSLQLVRHGRTTLNAEGRLLGRLDPELDAAGVAQAEAAAAHLASTLRSGSRVRIVSSPLGRARSTARIVAGALGVDDADVEVDGRWIELDYGDLDGVPLVEVPDRTWARWRRDADFCPPGGECLSALGTRVRAACADLAPWVAGGDEVVVVSHVSPIKAAVAWALDVGDLVAWRLYLAPGSVSRIGVTARGPALQEFNRVP